MHRIEEKKIFYKWRIKKLQPIKVIIWWVWVKKRTNKTIFNLCTRNWTKLFSSFLCVWICWVYFTDGYFSLSLLSLHPKCHWISEHSQKVIRIFYTIFFQFILLLDIFLIQSVGSFSKWIVCIMYTHYVSLQCLHSMCVCFFFKFTSNAIPTYSRAARIIWLLNALEKNVHFSTVNKFCVKIKQKINDWIINDKN